jgi:hypothetical protein
MTVLLHPPPLSRSTRINKLFEANRRADEPEESTFAVAQALAEMLGRPVSMHDLTDLREGRRTEPIDVRLLVALAAHFDAPTSYLAAVWDETARMYDSELTLLIQMRDSGVRLLAMRDGGDSIQGDLIDILKQLPGEVVDETRRT